MRGNTSLQLTLEAIDRVTGPLKRIEREIAMLERTANRSSRTMTDFGARGAATMKAVATAATVAAGAAALIGKEVISSAAKFETALTSIQKKAGTTAEQTAAIGETIKALGASGKVSASLYELAEAFDAGAGAGIPLDQLEQYAILTAKGADAFEMSNAAMGEFMGNLRFGMGQGNAEIQKTLDVINALADAGKAAESGIVSFVNNTGAQLKGLKVSTAQAAALGTTFLNIGVQQDVASTFTSAFATKLATVGTLTGKGRKTFEKYMGSVKGFAKLVQKDGNKAMLTMIERMEKLTASEQAEFGLAFVGLEHVDTFGRLVTASGDLRRNLALAGDETKWLGSLDKSYALKLQTFDAQWQMTKNAFEGLKIDAGNMLLPSVKAGLEEVRAYVQDFDIGLKLFPAMIDSPELERAKESVGNAMTAVSNLLGIDTTEPAILKFFTDLADAVNTVATAINAVADAVEKVKKFGVGSLLPHSDGTGPLRQQQDDMLSKLAATRGVSVDQLKAEGRQAAQRRAERTGQPYREPFPEIQIVKPLEIEGEKAVATAVELGDRIMKAAGIEAQPIINIASITGATQAVQTLDAALRALPKVGLFAPSVPAAQNVDGARALGGPIAAGGTYLVGERGPELVTPRGSGYVHTAARTANMLRSKNGGRDLFAAGRISASAPAAGRGGAAGPIDASIKVTINAASSQDREDFEQRLREHQRVVSELVAEGSRREGRRAF